MKPPPLRGMPTTLEQALSAPANSLIVFVNLAIYFVMWNLRWGVSRVSISYRAVVLEGQAYRAVSAAFCHLSLLHVLMNMYGLWGLGAVEARLGTLWYLETTLLLLGLGTAAWLGGVHLAVRAVGGAAPGQRGAAMADSSAVGYSGVLFGWMTLTMLREPSFAVPLPGGFALPLVVMPFVYLVLTKLFIPQSSLTGHAAGIAAGFAVGWGLCESLRGFWLWTSLAYPAFFVLLSLARSADAVLPAARAPWARRIVSASPELVAAAGGVGGGGAGAGSSAGSGGGSGAGPAASATRMGVDSNGVLRAWRAVEADQIVVAPSTLQGAPAAAPLSPTVAATSTAVTIAGGPPAPAPPRTPRTPGGSMNWLLQGLLGARFGPATASQEAAQPPPAPPPPQQQQQPRRPHANNVHASPPPAAIPDAVAARRQVVQQPLREESEEDDAEASETDRLTSPSHPRI